MTSKVKKIIITTGDPAGIGLDLCIKLAYKKFPANITVIGNLHALKNRAKFYKKNITVKENLSVHDGDGNLNFIDVPYRKNVVPGEIESKNSLMSFRNGGIFVCSSSPSFPNTPYFKNIVRSAPNIA